MTAFDYSSGAAPDPPPPVVCPQCGCVVTPVKECGWWVCSHCGRRIAQLQTQ
jgi:hypothetical protein